MRRNRSLLTVAGVLLCAVLLSVGYAQGAPRAPVILRVATTDDLINLDPTQTSQAGDRWLAENIFNGLVSYKPGTTQIQPDLAARWEVSRDGRVYTFALRRGVRFHRGYGEMTAADVKFSFERHLDPSAASVARTEFEVIEKIETPDAYTVRITLRRPMASFLGMLAWQPAFIVSEKAVRALGKQFSFQPVATGPFFLDRWTQGQEIVLSRFDDYYAGPARIDRLVFRVIRDELVSLLAFGKKEIDVVPVRELPAYKAMLGSEGSFNIVRATAGYYVLYINMTKPPLNDVRVRRALNYALDKAAMYRALGGMIQPNPSIFSPVTFGHTRDLPTYDYDPARAKQLLTEAGYPNGFKIRISYSQAFLYEEFATMIKDQWTRLGIDASLQVVDRALVSGMRRQKNYDVLPGSITRFEPEQHLLFFRGGSSQNYTGFNNSTVDGLMDRAAANTDVDARRKELVEIQRLIANDLPVIPLGAFQSIVVARKNVKGIYPTLYEGMVDYYLVWVEE